MTLRRRPRKVVELRDDPAEWNVEPEAIHLWRGALWHREPVGCVMCCERGGNTLSTADEGTSQRFFCAACGDLVAIPYTLRKLYSLDIGGVVREGELITTDTMLFPASLSLGQRAVLIEQLLDEAQADEVRQGPTP